MDAGKATPLGGQFGELVRSMGSHGALPHGATMRDFFAAHAPAEPQAWFTPVMEKRPDPTSMHSEDGLAIRNNSYDAWEHERQKQRYAQWPWAWADLVLAAREGKK